MSNNAQALISTKRADGVAIVSISDDPLNRMSLVFIDEKRKPVFNQPTD